MRNKVGIMVLTIWASASNAAELSDQLKQCRAVQNDLQRLTCYDKIGSGTFTPTNVVTEREQYLERTPTATSSAVSTTSPDNFGIEHKEVPQEQVTSIIATVDLIEQSKRGLWTITLNNGQKWRQISSDGFLLRKGEEVTISRGVFNSFLLTRKGSERQTKVARLQD